MQFQVLRAIFRGGGGSFEGVGEALGLGPANVEYVDTLAFVESLQLLEYVGD